MTLSEPDWALVKGAVQEVIDTTLSRSRKAELAGVMARMVPEAPTPAEDPKIQIMMGQQDYWTPRPPPRLPPATNAGARFVERCGRTPLLGD